MKSGSLVVVGTGIKAVAHITAEAVESIRSADIVLYGTSEPITADWILRNSKKAECLDRFYVVGGERLVAYEKMITEIVDYVRGGLKVCVSFEGHPGIFVYVSHESIRRLRKEGFRARMIPGISTQSALFCDLLFDPGECGCQSFDATDFLLKRYQPDVTSALVLWQAGCIGDFQYRHILPQNDNVRVLAEVLAAFYGEQHEVVAYQSPLFMVSKPVIKWTSIGKLHETDLALATLYVPPLRAPSTNADLAELFGV
ncbi:SAM-dependent methyltransferase [Nocardia sp. R7R-8]|uniref:SAM-dependent methyltransferase n=1 Tax=Nocardia sp. R7R-8 TaxID=3459304 RepID=UPI00403E07A3